MCAQALRIVATEKEVKNPGKPSFFCYTLTLEPRNLAAHMWELEELPFGNPQGRTDGRNSSFLQAIYPPHRLCIYMWCSITPPVCTAIIQWWGLLPRTIVLFDRWYILDISECDCPAHSKGHPTHSWQHPSTCASQQSTGPSGIHRVAFVTDRSRWQKLIFQCRQPAVVYNQPILWVSLVVRSTGSSPIWERYNYRREQMLVDQGPHTRNAQRPMLNTTINWCCGTRLKAEYQWTPLQRVPSASHLLQSRSAPVVSS